MKVSIITPVYNAEKFLEDTICSVQNQTYEDWEMILVDDRSTDNSKEIITRLSKEDSRIKYIELAENSGAAVARNTAIENATGRFIAFLDADDKWTEDKLEKQLKFMKEKNIGFSFTGYTRMTEEGELLNYVEAPGEMTYNQLLRNTAIGCLTVVVDREKVGDFRMPLVRKGQDFATWLSILKKGHNAYGLNGNLAHYRVVNNSLSSNKIGALKRTWNIYRNVENLSFIKSCYCFVGYAINAIKKRR